MNNARHLLECHNVHTLDANTGHMPVQLQPDGPASLALPALGRGDDKRLARS